MVLGVTVGAALLLYFFLMFFVFPNWYQIEPRRPEAVVTDAEFSKIEMPLGETLTVSVVGTNHGEDADMQIVSIGFPNLTRTDTIEIIQHDFTQMPQLINAGDELGSSYQGLATLVEAQYASVEAFSRPWEGGSSYSIEMQVKPETAGKFAVFVKSVAFPHSWDGGHWPAEGTKDHQQEFVQVYHVQVVKS